MAAQELAFSETCLMRKNLQFKTNLKKKNCDGSVHHF